jgi:hypothetical protein
VKASEKETSTVAVEPLTKEERDIYEAGVEGMRSGKVIPVLNLLLDQFLHHKPPSITEWSYHGPVEKLLDLMRERRGPDGIPTDAADFVTWLRTPENAKKVRAAQILVTFPPHPRNGKEVMVKIERACSPTEYSRLVDGVRV